MKNSFIYDLHNDERYESVKADIENSRFLRCKCGFFEIEDDKFYIVAYAQQYSVNELYRLVGLLEGKYGILKEVKTPE